MSARLFEITESFELKLNKEWIFLVEEFAALLKRDKGSKGDYRGEKKLKATSELTFVYFYNDFNSPIRDYDDDTRKREALIYAKLSEEDLDDAVWAASEKYFKMQVDTARSLRTLKSMYKALDAYDRYLENLDLTAKDKMGKLLNDPTAITAQFSKLDQMYNAIKSFENRVEEEMRSVAGGIRGPKTTLGDQEGKKKDWSESEISQGSAATGGPKTPANFSQVLTALRAEVKREMQEKPRSTASVLQEDDI